MREHVYINEFGEAWTLRIDEQGEVTIGGDETDGEFAAIGFPTLSGAMILSWREMAWLSCLMVQVEYDRMVSRKKEA